MFWDYKPRRIVTVFSVVKWQKIQPGKPGLKSVRVAPPGFNSEKILAFNCA